MLGVFFAVLIAAAPSPVPVSAAACPLEHGRVVEETNFTFPEGAHPTHGRVRFLIDVGSDGRIRRSALVESSGDAAVDDAASGALAQFRFAPPAVWCVASSSVTSRWWDLGADELATSSPAPSSPAPAPSPGCAAPFVRPYRMRLPAHRFAPGTATVDVSLDATARVSGVKLATSSGDKKADYAAAVAARNATYVFERQPGCTPVSTTYRLELTFR